MKEKLEGIKTEAENELNSAGDEPALGADQHFVADEMPPLVVAALPELDRRAAAAAARRRQRGGRGVIPRRGERAAERGNAPRADDVRAAVRQVVQRRRRRSTSRRCVAARSPGRSTWA